MSARPISHTVGRFIPRFTRRDSFFMLAKDAADLNKVATHASLPASCLTSFPTDLTTLTSLTAGLPNYPFQAPALGAGRDDLSKQLLAERFKEVRKCVDLFWWCYSPKFNISYRFSF